MTRVVTVALREFVETVKTRAFFIGVILMPVLVMGVVFGTRRIADFAGAQPIAPRRVAVADEHGAVFAHVERAVAEYNAANPARRFELVHTDPDPHGGYEARLAQVRAGDLYALVVVPREAVDGEAEARLTRKDSELMAAQHLQRIVNEAVQAVRFDGADPPIDRERVARLLRPVSVAELDLDTGVKRADDGFVAAMTPFAFMFVLYMATMGISWGLLTSVLEEKSSRVVELLLSAVSPVQLMAGKILGMVGVGALMLGVWAVVGLVAASAQDLHGVLSTARLAYMIAYFIPGFLLMAAMLAAIGGACNTLKEAQSMASPLTLLNIIPVVMWLPISQNPQSALSVALSFIPPITPFVMILRICVDPHVPLWQVLATLALLWAAVLAAVFAAGKIFRVGVLMYGKPPTLRELARWIRQA